MERLLLAILFVFQVGLIKAQDFKTVKIGNQEWMANNLNVNVPGSWPYNEDPAMGAKYGRLYTWEAAVKACPKGWHLPTLEEWTELLNYLGGEEKAGKLLKLSNFNFNAKLGGMTGVGNYRLLNSYGAFWTSTAVDKENAWFIYITKDTDAATSTYSVKTHGLSVRYIKNRS